jgi:hypothetical protein
LNNIIQRYFIPKKDGDSLLINISPNMVYLTYRPTEDVDLEVWDRVTDSNMRKEIMRAIFSTKSLATVGLT